jgi:hypothetical protein
VAAGGHEAADTEAGAAEARILPGRCRVPRVAYWVKQALQKTRPVYMDQSRAPAFVSSETTLKPPPEEWVGFGQYSYEHGPLCRVSGGGTTLLLPLASTLECLDTSSSLPRSLSSSSLGVASLSDEAALGRLHCLDGLAPMTSSSWVSSENERGQTGT